MKFEEEEYFSKKEILERLKWIIISLISLNIIMTIGFIQLLVFYNGILLLSIFMGIFIGFIGRRIYKKYKEKISTQ